MIDNTIGSCFSALRKSKHIPVKQIIGKNISNSQYHRFINDESEVSFSKFLFMLDQINITLEEFVFIAFKQTDPLKEGMLNIKRSFESGDISNLKILSENFKHEYAQTNQVKFEHLSIISNCLIIKFQTNAVGSNNSELKLLTKYLLNVENWGHYELVLFNNTFFLYDINTILILFKKAKKTSEHYKDLFHHTQELFKLYSNIILYFLEKQKVSSAIEIIDNLIDLKISEEQLYEKFILKFWVLVKDYLTTNREAATENINLLFSFLIFIECKNLQKLLQNIFDFIQKIPNKNQL